MVIGNELLEGKTELSPKEWSTDIKHLFTNPIKQLEEVRKLGNYYLTNLVIPCTSPLITHSHYTDISPSPLLHIYAYTVRNPGGPQSTHDTDSDTSSIEDSYDISRRSSGDSYDIGTMPDEIEVDALLDKMRVEGNLSAEMVKTLLLARDGAVCPVTGYAFIESRRIVRPKMAYVVPPSITRKVSFWLIWI